MPVKPMIELSGVRSSCDMVARKADFSRSAASARSLATASSAVRSATRRSRLAFSSRISSSARLSSVMSVPMLRISATWPCCVLHDPVGPGDPDALPIAAHVLIDVLFESHGIGADLVHELSQVASVTIGRADDGAHDMAADDLLGGVAEESLSELVEEGDPPVVRPAQNDAVGMLHELAVLPFAFAQGGLGLRPGGGSATDEHHG